MSVRTGCSVVKAPSGTDVALLEARPEPEEEGSPPTGTVEVNLGHLIPEAGFVVWQITLVLGIDRAELSNIERHFRSGVEVKSLGSPVKRRTL